MGPSVADLPTLSRLYDTVASLAVDAREAWFAALPDAERRFEAPLRDMLARQQAHGDNTGPALPQLGEPPDLATPHAGDRIGPYRLLNLLGQGGMGTVWLAERVDGGLRRRVALKLPRLAWGAGLAERMARERDIGALLEHPNIARLYDAGVDALGRPFLALEVIDGQPIDEYCAAHALDVPARLRLFVQVVRAVAYAHGRLVVHRDLKPSNVLVSADGAVHLLDFGIAKLLDDSAPQATLTQQGRVMTPLYASPEQMESGIVTVQSDVYSLGVLLYELLAGRLPFDTAGRAPAALEQAILSSDAPPASTRAADRATRRALRGELDAILAKALRRRTEERYASADALAQDIERHLAGDPVSAKPDSLGYRMRKFARRHWLPLTAATTVLAAGLAGGSVAALQFKRAAQQAERAKVVTAFVTEMFRVGAQTLLPDSTPAATSPLDRSLGPAAQLIEARFAGQPDLQAELYGAVGQVYTELWSGRQAVEYIRREIASLERTDAEAETRARAWMQLVEAQARAGRNVDAEISVREAIRLATPGSRLEFDALTRRSVLLDYLGRMDESRQIEQQLLKSRWAPPAGRSMGAAQLIYGQAYEHFSAGRVDESLVQYRQAFAIATALEGRQSEWLARTRMQLARYLAEVNREEGFAFHDETIRDLQAGGGLGRLRAAVAAARFWERVGAVPVRSHADVMRELAAVRNTLDEFKSVLPPGVMARLEMAQGVTDSVYGDTTSAYERLSAAVPVLVDATDNRNDQTYYRSMLGLAAMNAGQHAQADRLHREWFDYRGKVGMSQTPFAAFDWVAIAHNLVMQGRSQAAAELLSKAPTFAAFTGDLRAGQTFAEAIPRERARVRLELGDLAGALAELPSVDSLPPDVDNAYTSYAHQALRGEIWCASDQAKSGLALLQRWMQALAPLVSPNDPSLARVRAVAGLCALKAGNTPTAQRLARESHQAFEHQPGVSPWFKKPLARLEQALASPATR